VRPTCQGGFGCDSDAHSTRSSEVSRGSTSGFQLEPAPNGKSGAAILAADYILARTILVVTTASGRGVWRRAFPAWSAFDRTVGVIGVDAKNPDRLDVVIVSWDSLAALPALSNRPDLIILDEDHRATNPAAARTQIAYGRPIDGGRQMITNGAVVQPEDRVWHLSGLPMPHDLGNAWPRLRASFPERLGEDHGPSDVTRFEDFRHRYCVVKTKRLSNFQSIPVVFGGRNVGELAKRLDGTFVRHTQADVGIAEPRYEILPLIVSAAQRRAADGDADQSRVLEAAETGATRDLEMELGTLRRVTGTIKAAAVVTAVKEEFANGIEKLVLAYWHRDVGDVLESGLAALGVLRLDGSTTARERESLEGKFRAKKFGIFLAQIKAAGEAIDLSAANEMWVVETSLSPGDMDQISKRIVNVGSQRPTFVKVVTLEGTIDQILQEILLRLWAPIKEVMR
jgi:hypothetical protein